jgi:hypothetical protein
VSDLLHLEDDRSQTMSHELSPWIKRWWDIANDRRQKLIVKQYKRGGLTKKQEAELIMLQRVAEEIIDFVARPDRKVIRSMEEFEKKYFPEKQPTITPGQVKEALARGEAGAKELDKKLDAVFRPLRPGEGPVLT